ncbi:MAG: zinc metalloprotease HtpX [Candidatus Saccharimonas sp.]
MKQGFKTTLLMAGMTGLFMAVGYALAGQGGMLIALAFAGFSNLAMYWMSDTWVLKMQRAKPLGSRYPQVKAIVEDLAQRESMPMPKLYYVDTPIPNAFATGRSPKHAAVAVTAGIMDILTDDELRAVLAHELGHVKNRDMLVSTIAATMAGAISYIAQFALFFGGGNREGSNPIVSILAMILTPIAAMVIQLAVSRSREYLADEHSAKTLHSGKDLESALMKLETWKQRTPPITPTHADQVASTLMFSNMFSTKGMASLFSTHPSTADRIKRLRAIDKRY